MYEIFEQLLQARNLTHYKVWKATGVPQSSLSDWRYGKSKPGADKLAKLADYFGVSVDYLLGREEHSEKPDANQGIGLHPERQAFYDMVTTLNDREFQMVREIVASVLRERGE